MTAADPLHLDVREFLSTGALGVVRLGESMAALRERLPPAEEWAPDATVAVWSYGALELHFYSETLFLIWCDSLPALRHTSVEEDRLTVDPWVICGDRPRSLAEMLPEFARQGWGIRLSVPVDPRYSVNVKILDSDVDLHFEAPAADGGDGPPEWSRFELVAFGLGGSQWIPETGSAA